MSEITYNDLTDIVGDSVNSFWGGMKKADEQLASLIDGNASTVKGVRQKKNCPSLLNAIRMARHTPPLRDALLELLGVDLSASSEAKRIQQAMAALRGEFDENIQGNGTGLPQVARVQRVN